MSGSHFLFRMILGLRRLFVTKLTDSYEIVRGSLQPQVQGTCGLYSFYVAARILQQATQGRAPLVPKPRSGDQLKGVKYALIDVKHAPGKSLRKFSKDEFHSGQGEILTESEMTRLVDSHGYKALSFSGDESQKKIFITTQLLKGYPILIPYLAGGRFTDYATMSDDDPGAHWSVIIDLRAPNYTVVNPWDPRSSREYPVANLLQSNALADFKPFVQYWEKPSVKRANGRYGLAPVGDVAPLGEATGKVYDLGGPFGNRHLLQKLKNVLIAVMPP
jgi:hypothetical protein